MNEVKSAKFFLQFQIARVKTALGQTLGVADTVEHQLGKVIKVCRFVLISSKRLRFWCRMPLARLPLRRRR